MSDEHISDEIEAQGDELDLYEDEAGEVEEYEEISSEEVDRVVAALEDLLDTVDSENIKSYLDEAITNIYFLVYDEEDDIDPEIAADAA